MTVNYLAEPVRLIEERLILPTGEPYGASIQPWQRDFFQAIFAADEKGRPVHRLLYDERRRGESKTEDSAAAALVDLIIGPPRHRSYCVAADADQAALLLDSIQGFKSRSPILEEIQVQRMVVRNLATDSELRVMSSDDRTAFGIRPRKVFFDELSLQTDERLWLAMWTAIGKSPASQMVAVSMAGWDFASLGWRIRELARSSPHYYFHTREGSTLAPWLSVTDMDEQRATLHPADFARYWECKWVEPKGSWITSEMYSGAEKGRESLKGDGVSRYVGFVDIGLTHDATAIAVCHGEGRERVVLDTLVTLQGTRNEPVELEAIEDEVVSLTKRFEVKYWVFEAWQGVGSVQRLQSRLRGCEVEARHPTADTQNQLWSNLYYLFQNRLLTVYPHERLKQEALALLVRKVGGRLKPVESSSIHQDHILAVGGAATLLMPEEDAPVFVMNRHEYMSPWRDGNGSSNPFDYWPMDPD